MSSKDTRLRKLIDGKIKVDYTIEELAKVLQDWGFVWKRGNHNIFTHPLLDYHLSIPIKKGIILGAYIKQAREAVLEIIEKSNKE